MFVRLGRRVSRDDGLSLIEMMIAIFVLAVAVMAVAAVASSSLASLRLSRDRQHATNAASTAIEDVRSRDFDSIALDASAPGLPSPACYPAADDPEPLVTRAAASDPVPFTTTAGPGGKITVSTYVTWFDDPETTSPTGCDHEDRQAKRITAVATWSEGNQTRTVTESTVVAEAGRGLPVPRFTVSAGGSRNWARGEIQNGTEKCISNVLRNFGAEDSYDWSIANAATNSTLTLSSTTFSDNRWKARMFFEHPVQSSPPDVLSIPTPSGVDLMTDNDGDQFPEAEARVENAETARLWVCYEPDQPSDSANYSPRSYRVSVRSRFDSRVVQTTTHEITIGTPSGEFRLTDTCDEEAHVRGAECGPDPDVHGVYVMGPVDSTGPERPHPRSTAGPCGLFLPNWDVDHDDVSRTISCRDEPVLGYPGTRIPAGDAALDMLWHRQFTSRTDLENARLVFWSSYEEALDVHQGVPGAVLPEVSPTISYRVQLEILDASEGEQSPRAIIWDTTHSYPHTEDGWMPRPLEVQFSPPLPRLTTHQYLRLRISCTSESGADCHIAYDSEQYPSALTVGTR